MICPLGASNAFQEAENGDAIVYLPTIAAAELFYLFKKKRRRRMWSRFKNEMSDESNAGFQYFPFDKEVLEFFEKTRAKEIHDKIIVSTVKATKSDALITKDKEVTDLKEVKTLW